ncbi:uncharacterized protein N7473_011204 [Penicillium subrubescens]|uniref:uncharacterized protein n=1 Tax=Penicillium subrubescens TaxID=1316194 RepID=UPI002544FDE1|nr:uncharacterized protein N7473_011204 [Penicillium subrubescens]KAJ5882770.1 hypothetical protein N7473_011204 [Penicillium subrubescens]
MEQTQHREVPREIWLAIDFGTNTTEVAVSVDPTNPAGTADYLLKFPSSASTQVENYTTELDTTIVFTKDAKKFSFGSDGASYANREMFRHWKLGTMGVKPYDENLIESCRGVQQCLGLEHGHFTPASLFRILFEHILKTAKDHLRNEYGESFGPIKAWLTYPVSCGESIRILLLQEAIAAGIVVMGLSPNYSQDATIIYKNDDGQLVQACATDGLPKGGQMVNELCRSWLQANFPDWKSLWDDDHWATYISPFFDQCKRAFDGQSTHELFRGDGSVEIPPDVMQGFFLPLISGAEDLVIRMCDRARKAGHPVNIAVVCGGTVRNKWFRTELFRRLKEHGITTCEKIDVHGIVALGALQYARLDVEEELVITRNLGLGYVGDYDENGSPLKKGEWLTGIGWILREGQDPKEGPGCLKFTKKIQPRSKEAGDLIIESKMHVTPPDSRQFGEEHIKRNDLIEWECDITYPATEEIFSYLSHLGTFSGEIPHKKLFPLGTETKEREFEFELTLQNDRQLLRGVFAVMLDGERCLLHDVYYTPLPLVPRSEYLNQQGQLRRRVKRGAGAANVDDRLDTRHPNLRSSSIAILPTLNTSTEPSRSSGSPDSGSPNSGSPDSGSLDSGSPRHPPYLPDDLPSVRGPSRPDHTASSSLQHRNAPPGSRYPIRYIPPPSEDVINQIINDLPRLAGHRGTNLSV